MYCFRNTVFEFWQFNTYSTYPCYQWCKIVESCAYIVGNRNLMIEGKVILIQINSSVCSLFFFYFQSVTFIFLAHNMFVIYVINVCLDIININNTFPLCHIHNPLKLPSVWHHCCLPLNILNIVKWSGYIWI